MVNLVQEVRRAMTLKEEVYFDRPRYGLIEIMRGHRSVCVKREALDLPPFPLSGEVLGVDNYLADKGKTPFSLVREYLEEFNRSGLKDTLDFDYFVSVDRILGFGPQSELVLRILSEIPPFPELGKRVSEKDCIDLALALIRETGDEGIYYCWLSWQPNPKFFRYGRREKSGNDWDWCASRVLNENSEYFEHLVRSILLVYIYHLGYPRGTILPRD